MNSYCLMHSSGQGPEGWKLLVQELDRRGHRVFTPAFHVSRTDEGLVYHAETIVEAIRRSGFQSQEVVCVAHSAAGMYLPLVAERLPPRRMVFLAAIVPRPGLGVIDARAVLCEARNGGTLSAGRLACRAGRLYCVHRRPDDHAGVAAQGCPRVARSRSH